MKGAIDRVPLGNTFVCWSILQRLKTHNSQPIHLQGDPFGKSGRTLCGVVIGQMWDFDMHDVHCAADIHCHRCRTAYNRSRHDGR